MSSIHIGESSELHKPTNDAVVNPNYHNNTDNHCRTPVGELTRFYEEVDVLSEVKMTQNPAYVVS